MAIKKEKLNNVLFGGYYGQKNIGDDCFGAISAWGAKTIWNSKKISLLTNLDIGAGSEVKLLLSDRNILWRQRGIETVVAILKSPVIIWSGGSIFHSKERAFSPKRISTFLTGFGGRKVGAIGVSLGPYKTINDEKYVASTLKRFSFLALRDSRSWLEAKSLDLPYNPILASDLAWLLPKAVQNDKRNCSEKPILGVSICHFEQYRGKQINNEARRENIVLASLKKLIDHGFKGTIRFFVFNGNQHLGDKQLTKFFVDALECTEISIEIIDYLPSPFLFWKVISECTAVISIRLHGYIYSAAANVPSILVEYHKKCTDILDDLEIRDEWRVGDVECTVNELVDKIEQLLLMNYENFYPNRIELIDRSSLNFTGIIE